MQVIPLGTASALPAYDRHLSSTALLRKGRLLLFDCGEGTQYRLVRAGLKLSRVDAIFITHLHGDHCFGLPGLLSTLSMLERTEPVVVAGPAGVESFSALPSLDPEGLSFPLTFRTLEPEVEHARVFDTDEVWVEARPLEHRTPTFGYRFQEKERPGQLFPEKARALGATEYEHFRRLKRGEAVELEDGRVVMPEEVLGPPRPGASFAYVTDTRPAPGGVALAEEASLVYHDATFGSEYEERAEKTGHATAREAAGVARRAGAERLLLGHFSARYEDPDVLAEEARTVFSNTEVAEELKRYPLKS